MTLSSTGFSMIEEHNIISILDRAEDTMAHPHADKIFQLINVKQLV